MPRKNKHAVMLTLSASIASALFGFASGTDLSATTDAPDGLATTPSFVQDGGDEFNDADGITFQSKSDTRMLLSRRSKNRSQRGCCKVEAGGGCVSDKGYNRQNCGAYVLETHT